MPTNDGSAEFYISVGAGSPNPQSTVEAGNILRGLSNGRDPDGDSWFSYTYNWEISTDKADWELVHSGRLGWPIGTPDTNNYEVKKSDAGKYIRLSVAYTDDEGYDEIVFTSSVAFRSSDNSLQTEINNLRSQLASVTYSGGIDSGSLGYGEQYGSANGEFLMASGNQIVWGLNGNDSLYNSYSTDSQVLLGGTGDDSYHIQSSGVTVVYEAPSHGYDTLYLDSNYLFGNTYAASIDNRHIVAVDGNEVVVVLDAWDAGIDKINFGGYQYSTSYFLSIIDSMPGYLGNISWDQLKPYVGDSTIETAKRAIDDIKASVTRVESSLQDAKNLLNGKISSLESELENVHAAYEVHHSSHSIGGEYYLWGIRDYDGNFHASTGIVSSNSKESYKYQGMIDVNNDGTPEAIYTNKETGRWVTGKVDPITGQLDYSSHGQGGVSRVVGIYIDPLVQSGLVAQGGEFDSQRRFQNDLFIDNLSVKFSLDFDRDGFQEVYWKTNDGTAYLRALMHADGNIQYANYQSEQQMTDYLTGNGYGSVVSDIV